jgi:hypothetical protein
MTEEASGSGSATEQDLPESASAFRTSRAAPTGIGPQNDFPGSYGAPWPVFGREVIGDNTVANFLTLGEVAESADMAASVSPHHDHSVEWEWGIAGPAERLLKALRVPARSGPLIVEDLPLSGTDLLERFKQRILGPDILCGGATIVDPRKSSMGV